VTDDDGEEKGGGGGGGRRGATVYWLLGCHRSGSHYGHEKEEIHERE